MPILGQHDWGRRERKVSPLLLTGYSSSALQEWWRRVRRPEHQKGSGSPPSKKPHSTIIRFPYSAFAVSEVTLLEAPEVEMGVSEHDPVRLLVFLLVERNCAKMWISGGGRRNWRQLWLFPGSHLTICLVPAAVG